MVKPATAYYVAAIPHKQVPGIFQASFGMPGDAPAWVLGHDGRPDVFTNALEAELAGYRVLISKLNKARGVQEVHVKGSGKHQIRSYRAPEGNSHQAEIDAVFGKKKQPA